MLRGLHVKDAEKSLHNDIITLETTLAATYNITLGVLTDIGNTSSEDQEH